MQDVANSLSGSLLVRRGVCAVHGYVAHDKADVRRTLSLCALKLSILRQITYS